MQAVYMDRFSCSQFYGVRSGFDLPRNEGNRQKERLAPIRWGC
jgi:hypothetical protein